MTSVYFAFGAVAIGRFNCVLKGLFTWRWGTPGCWGNPLRWGNRPVHTISHIVTHLSCKRDHIKMRDYMDRWVTPPKRITSLTWGSPPPCKQALNRGLQWTATATKTSLQKWIRAASRTLSRLFYLCQFVKCWQFFLELNSEKLYRSSGKEKEVVVAFSRRFHVVVVQWRQCNVAKTWCTCKAVVLLI